MQQHPVGWVKKATPHGILKAEIVVPIEMQHASPDF
jgi:hypothetical protein